MFWPNLSDKDGAETRLIWGPIKKKRSEILRGEKKQRIMNC